MVWAIRRAQARTHRMGIARHLSSRELRQVVLPQRAREPRLECLVVRDDVADVWSPPRSVSTESAVDERCSGVGVTASACADGCGKLQQVRTVQDVVDFARR